MDPGPGPHCYTMSCSADVLVLGLAAAPHTSLPPREDQWSAEPAEPALRRQVHLDAEPWGPAGPLEPYGDVRSTTRELPPGLTGHCPRHPTAQKSEFQVPLSPLPPHHLVCEVPAPPLEAQPQTPLPLASPSSCGRDGDTELS